MIKDVMVHLDGSDEDEVRLAHAEALAPLCGDAKLTGLFTNLLPEYAYHLSGIYGMTDVGEIAALEERLRQEGERVLARLKERLNRLDPNNEVRRLDAYPSQMAPLAAAQSRWIDLFVATTPYRDPLSSWDRLVEAVLFSGGRGLYLVPPGCKARGAMNSILFPWQNTPESAHAALQALPLLRLAGSVKLLLVDGGEHGAKDEEIDAAAVHLARHGVKVEVAGGASTDGRVAEAILTAAERASADLIVMGAYGHSRFREWILGGVTREVIENAPHPLFLAH